MLWRLVRKLARLYGFVAIVLLLAMVMSARMNPRPLSPDETMLALFVPYGMLAGLVISWLFMKMGALITLLALGGFYLTVMSQTGSPPAPGWTLVMAGPAPLFLIAGTLKSIASRLRRTGKSRKKK